MSPDDPRHGTPNGHRAGCREACCVEARNRYERNGRKRRELGQRRLIDATGTRRRIQALMRLGWTGQQIAERAGIPRGQSSIDTLVRRTKRVTVERAAAIAAVYDDLSMTLGESVVTRARAERNGWPPPLAWDDESIDDPDATPHLPRTRDQKFGRNHVDPVIVERVLLGEDLPTTTAERREITRRWVADGRSEAELCRRLGWRGGRYRPGTVGSPGDAPVAETSDRKAS